MEVDGNNKPESSLVQASSNNKGGSETNEKSSSSSSLDKMHKLISFQIIKKLTSKQRIWTHMKEHFHKVYKADGVNVLALFKSMMTQLQSHISEEIEAQLDASSLEKLLLDLDALSKEQTNQHWRPSGNASKDVAAHLQSTSQQELAELEKILSVLEAQNKVLCDKSQRWNEKMQQSKSKLNTTVTHWREASLVFSEEVKESLVDISKT